MKWNWRWTVLIAVLGLYIGVLIGQTHGIRTRDFGRTGSFTLWQLQDDLNHITCYGLVPDGFTQSGAAISCVNTEVAK
jgi:hypothetical protein